ncbi:MAG: hypothetical protein R3C19_26025 [Planctomycetaceae bacterium]
MDGSMVLPLIARVAHVGVAILLVGGTAFNWLVLMPAMQGESPELAQKIRNRWKRFVHVGILLFLTSGFYNYLAVTGPQHKGDGTYHMLLGIKILLALVVFFFASALVGRSAGTQKIRDDARKWMGVVLLIAAVIVGISGFVKVRPSPAGSVDSASASGTDADASKPADSGETR